MSQLERNKPRTLSVIEQWFVKSGTIQAVRAWKGKQLHELDIHLPQVALEEWDQAQSIKCRITPMHYTGYKPARWEVAQKTCTLYIDTSHLGAGSLWAQYQRAGDELHYLKIEPKRHAPLADKHLVFLADQTAIGHFCALQQLAAVGTPISGFVTFPDTRTADGLAQNCPQLPVQAVIGYQTINQQLQQQLAARQAQQETLVFYVVGNTALIVALRKRLRAFGISTSQIHVKSYWP